MGLADVACGRCQAVVAALLAGRHLHSLRHVRATHHRRWTEPAAVAGGCLGFRRDGVGGGRRVGIVARCRGKHAALEMPRVASHGTRFATRTSRWRPDGLPSSRRRFPPWRPSALASLVVAGLSASVEACAAPARPTRRRGRSQAPKRRLSGSRSWLPSRTLRERALCACAWLEARALTASVCAAFALAAVPALLSTPLRTWTRWIPAEVQHDYGTEYARLTLTPTHGPAEIAALVLAGSAALLLAIGALLALRQRARAKDLTQHRQPDRTKPDAGGASLLPLGRSRS